MKEEEINHSIYRFVDAYNNFDIDAMIGMLAPEIRFENISGGEGNAKLPARLSLKSWQGNPLDCLPLENKR
jgi:hypothetical protein